MAPALSLCSQLRRGLYLGHQRPPIFFIRMPRVLFASTSQLQNTRLYTSRPPPPPNETPSSSLKGIMRKIPHPVVIVTSATTSSPPSWRGITLSSFNCFSLSPIPLVSFNIKTPSSAASTMTNAGRFAVHIFKPTPRSAFLAGQFAQLGAAHSSKISPFSFTKSRVTLADVESSTGPPLLGREDDVLFRLHCETFRTIQIEDHQFWVGEVKQVDVVGEVEDVESAGAGAGEVFSLMYSDRHFRHVGRALVPEGSSDRNTESHGEVEGNIVNGSLPSEERGSGNGR